MVVVSSSSSSVHTSMVALPRAVFDQNRDLDNVAK
jgi:hypothetical protein